MKISAVGGVARSRTVPLPTAAVRAGGTLGGTESPRGGGALTLSGTVAWGGVPAVVRPATQNPRTPSATSITPPATIAARRYGRGAAWSAGPAEVDRGSASGGSARVGIFAIVDPSARRRIAASAS